MKITRKFSKCGQEATIFIKNFTALEEQLHLGVAFGREHIGYERKIYDGCWHIKWKV